MQNGAVAADLIDSLPERYNPKQAKVPPTRFHLVVGDVERDVVVGPSGCKVEEASGDYDVEIQTDARTWRRMYDGKISGIEAFAGGNVEIRGSIDKSLLFEVLFDRPDAGGFRYTLEHVSLGGRAISTLCAGDEDAPPLILIHGLGASKASWLPVVPALAKTHRIYAIDLPGFGSSSKPRGKYTASWLAEHVFRFMDMVDLDSAFVAGNSLGGRVTMEMAMMEPERVRGIACLCPASAFSYRPGLPIVKLLRPEMGFVVARLPRTYIRDQLKQLFCDPSSIHEDWYDAAIDDFLGRWKTVRGRLAFFAALRNIYLDEPDGEEGFWARLTDVKVPSLFIYGRRDVLITHNFSKRVRKHLPSAKVKVWNDCGHVPQLEHPERTVDEMTKFFSSVEASAKAV
jgi:pimeloyl-ACP methyl ester carboxylesterase/putative sterol carrier protein